MWRTRGEKTSDFPFKTGLFHRIHKHYYNYPYLLIYFSFFRCAEGDRRKRSRSPLSSSENSEKEEKREKEKEKKKTRKSPAAKKTKNRENMCRENPKTQRKNFASPLFIKKSVFHSFTIV